MAPFVFVPIVLIEGLLIILINFIFKLFRKNISDIFNLSLFLIIFTLFMFYESSWLFFHNLFSNELLVGHTTRLMYLPVIFGTICVFYMKKGNVSLINIKTCLFETIPFSLNYCFPKKASHP